MGPPEAARRSVRDGRCCLSSIDIHFAGDQLMGGPGAQRLKQSLDD